MTFVDNPIAITAMAGIFPGAPDVDAYWERLLAARSAPTQSLLGRWGRAASDVLDSTIGTAGRTYLGRGHCLADLGSPSPWDRQTRYGRAVVARLYRSLGRDAGTLKTRRTALVVGTSWSGEGLFVRDALLHGDGEAPEPIPATTTSGQLEGLAHRRLIAGPRLAVDGACASSLMALDAAVAMLRTDQSDAVVVVGVNGMLPLFMYLGFARIRALSPTGQLRPFAADADGIVPGEAAGALLVEPLDRALRGGRTPIALLRGVGLSSDGAERSPFAPGTRGQELALARAYRDTDPDSIAYLEGHGTGTTIGDQTELAVIGGFFQRPEPRRLPVGSAKGIIGHTLAASGMAALIKGLLVLRHRTVPPHPCRSAHAAVKANGTTLLSEARLLGPETLRVGVSAMGFGGNNAHVVLESAPSTGASGRNVAMGGAGLETHRTSTRAHPTSSRPAEPTSGEPSTPSVQVIRPGLAILDAETLFSSAVAVQAGPRAGTDPGCNAKLLPRKLQVDAHGLRAGPAAVARLDPFQMLATHLALRVLRRIDLDRAPLDEVGLVLVTNVGGPLAYRLSRCSHSSDPAATVPTIDQVASSMPNMCSGYPAFHADLRGQHATLSGGGGVFLRTLLLAPDWLERYSRLLLLGAGRVLKSPVDLTELPASTHAGEAVGLLALKSQAAASKDGDSPLATLESVVLGAVDATHACRAAGLAEGDVDGWVRCQLDPRGPVPSGWATARTGQLGEAAGLEGLVAALDAPGRLIALELHDGPRLGAVVFLRNQRQRRRPEVAAARSPVEIELGSAASVLSRCEDRSALGVRPSPVPGVPRLLLSTAHPTATARRARRRNDRVLSHLSIDGARTRAVLRIDRRHPFFFDHPLDHLPGVLLIEGALQASEPLRPEPTFVSEMSMTFRRFATFDAPTHVRLERQDARVTGSIRQGARAIASVALRCEPVPRTTSPIPFCGEPEIRAVDRSLVHKHRAENVLVADPGPLAGRPETSFRIPLLPPPPEHFLGHGTEQMLSMTYLAETNRQCVMVAAHRFGSLPPSTPMTMLAMSLSLARPVTRGEPLSFVLREPLLTRAGTHLVAELEADLFSGDEAVGTSRNKGLVVTDACRAGALR